MIRNQENQELTSSLNVQLTGDEYARLQSLATDLGMKPAIYARKLLLATLKSKASPSLNDSNEPPADLGIEAEENRQGICVFDMGSIQLDAKAARALMDTLKKFTNCKTITPKDMGYEEADRIIREEI